MSTLLSTARWGFTIIPQSLSFLYPHLVTCSCLTQAQRRVISRAVFPKKCTKLLSHSVSQCLLEVSIGIPQHIPQMDTPVYTAQAEAICLASVGKYRSIDTLLYMPGAFALQFENSLLFWAFQMQMFCFIFWQFGCILCTYVGCYSSYNCYNSFDVVASAPSFLLFSAIFNLVWNRC